jgi:hypothetical protein
MLNRIIIINSELYSKADILIGDSTSIQLEADSNVGKSSLINTLNFLYIIDQGQMLFEGDRKLKESMKHYFKTVNQSFVIFEINKSGYTYCILVKANGNFELEYYKFNSSYKEEYFFEKTDKGFAPISFEKVVATLLLKTQSKPEQLKADELYDIVYSKKSDNKPVVLTTDKITRTGKSHSNSFTKIYHLLLKSSDIDETKFKDALTIAANVNEETLPVFANNTNKKVEQLKQTELEVKNLRAIQEEFKILKKLNDDYNAISRLCSELKNTFEQQFNKETQDIKAQLDYHSDLQRGIRTLQTKITETLAKQFTEHKQNETKYATLAEGENKNLKKFNDELALIDQFKKGSLPYSGLLSELDKLKEENTNLLSELQKIKKEKLTESQLQAEVGKLETQVSQLERKGKEFDKILGQNISDNIEIKQKLNSILNPKVLELNTDKTSFKKVTKTSDLLKIFDGEIEIGKVKIDPIETIDDVREAFKTAKKLLESKKKTLEFVRETSKMEKEQAKVEKLLNEKQQLFDKIENRETTIAERDKVQALIDDYKIKELDSKSKAFDTDQEIKKTQILLNAEEKKRDAFKAREITLKEHHERTKEFDLPPTDKLLNKNIDEAYSDLLKQISELNKKEHSRFELFVFVNKDLKIDEKDINRFIQTVQQKIDNIKDLDTIYKDLLQLVYTEFTQPTTNFLDKYNHFQRFITDYNKELDDFPVSNITKLSIVASDVQKEVQALTRISKLDQKADLFSTSLEQAESIKALEDKIREGKEIKFAELFELKISIEIDGVKKPPIDLGKQVESRATDRVLKLFLFLSIIRRLVQNAPDNKIVLYIDELGEIGPHNVRQIINYCTKYNFIPIFAAPRQIEGIEKYYVIKKASKKQPLKVDNANVKSIRYKNAKPVVS